MMKKSLIAASIAMMSVSAFAVNVHNMTMYQCQDDISTSQQCQHLAKVTNDKQYAVYIDINETGGHDQPSIPVGATRNNVETYNNSQGLPSLTVEAVSPGFGPFTRSGQFATDYYVVSAKPFGSMLQPIMITNDPSKSAVTQ